MALSGYQIVTLNPCNFSLFHGELFSSSALLELPLVLNVAKVSVLTLEKA